ncbi:DUF4405 domain-containing protein [Labilibaculum antarcticum]|uniref:Flavinylation-associated cytochrome domain-containing protein n=1 Tax=Labilibaculum antarcticum TaxID=1717717 RepID=A0A1Y1CPA6_9BACT|nr:DUF4405 domain-containing protein [Labilibaculum antarcticum]BAX82195.1 hypothetical protein ALGA_3903 [Labilibaculum antarcticum]
MKDKVSKTTRNYYVDIISLTPFLLMIGTGIIMLIYHTGKPYCTETLSIDGNTWLIIHELFSVISFILVVIHLTIHIDWLKNLFFNKLSDKHKSINITLFIVFSLTALTAFSSWLIVSNTEISEGLRGAHNKLGLLLIIFFSVHITNYFKWLVKMTNQVFSKKKII